MKYLFDFMKVVHARGRFYIKTAGGEAELLYKIDGRIMIMYHTFVPESERGKNIAGELAKAAFKYAEENGFRVRPACSYIEYYAGKHKELDSIIDTGV